MRWLDGITDKVNMGLGRLWELVVDREAWHTAIHGSQRVRHNRATELNINSNMDGEALSICVHKETFCLRMDNVSEVIARTNCFSLEVLCDEGGSVVMVDNEKRLCWGNCTLGPS